MRHPAQGSDREVRGSVTSAYGFAAAIASAMACTSAEVSALREPMPPLLLLIAFWMFEAVRAFLLKIGLIGPWHTWHFCV